MYYTRYTAEHKNVLYHVYILEEIYDRDWYM